MWRDGPCQVRCGPVCAGFVVEGGQITKRAPILRRWSLTNLMALAVWIVL